MKVFFSTLLTGLALVAFFVYWVDPAGRWHHKIQFPNHALHQGEVWVTPKVNFDDRALRFSQIKFIESPQLLLLGSSRVLPVSSHYFRPGTGVFNAGVVGPLVYDFIGIWQALKEVNKLPTHVIIFADPWIINGYAPLFYHWSVNTYIRHFLNPEKSMGLTEWSEASQETGMFFDNLYHQFTELLGWKEFRYAFEYVKLYGAYQPTPYITLEEKVPKGANAYRWDGSVLMWDNNSSIEDIQKTALSEVDRKDGLSLTPWRQDDHLLKLLESLLIDAKRKGVRVMIVLPPYHPYTYRLYKEREEYQQALAQYRLAFREQTSIFPNVMMCDAVDPASVPCSQDEFNDWIHMRQSCIKKVMAECLEQDKEWAALLSK